MRYMKIKQTLWFIAVFVDDSVHYFLLEFRTIKQYNDPKPPRFFTQEPIAYVSNLRTFIGYFDMKRIYRYRKTIEHHFLSA